jgi:tetratricopeptide (TPR) repeat protein
MKSRVLLVFLALAVSAAAQLNLRITVRQVHVRIAFQNGGCDSTAHVTLVGHDVPLAQASVDGHCAADFFDVPTGKYKVSVYGQSFSQTDSESIEVTPAVSAEFLVTVKRMSEMEQNYLLPASALVSASDLGIPARARKELRKADELLAKRDLPQALQSLNTAVAIYPSYALAYNNLGVIYARLGDRERAREALHRAISVNDHFALAYVNLGRMSVVANDFSSAEDALIKASAFDPTDATTLMLLAYAELMDGRLDDAITSSRQAHAIGKPHAFVHRVAARAFEQKRQLDRAITELQTFLEEAPSGPRADEARHELEVVQSLVH